MDSISDFVGSFEPVDVLNGVSELVDAAGNVITIHTDDPRVIEDNEYPKNFEGVYYELNPSRQTV